MSEVSVSDHAVLRYMERVKGVDVEAIRQELQVLAQPFADVGAIHAPLGGVWLIFDRHVLVTVRPNKPNNASNRRHDRGERVHIDFPTDHRNWKARARKRGHK